MPAGTCAIISFFNIYPPKNGRNVLHVQSTRLTMNQMSHSFFQEVQVFSLSQDL